MGKIEKKLDSRRIFIDKLIELAHKDKRIVLIVPDVGFNYIEEFKMTFPRRYYNLGVTEQSAIIIATAMALSGMKPYVYSMINFVLFRPYEMVRNAVVQHNADVKLIGVKGSEKYKFLGFSHNLISAKEDINACKNIGLRFYVPEENNKKGIIRVMNKVYKSNEPFYIRL